MGGTDTGFFDWAEGDILRSGFITPERDIGCPVMTRSFNAQGAVAARLQITGLGLYRAFLNGQRIGGDYLTPGFNDYDAYLRYQTYDITELLRRENRLEVYLGDGWYKGRFGANSRDCIYGERYLLCARLVWTDASGAQTVIETDERWRAYPSPIIENSIYDGETRDDTLAPHDEIGCLAVKTAYAPVPSFSPPIRARETLRPVLTVSPEGENILDFGQNMAGVVRFRCRAPYGTRILMQFGEVLQNGCFYRGNLRSARAEYVYVADGVEKEVEPLFTFFGFRYAKVEGLEHVNPADFTGVAIYSDLRETLHVQTDHGKLNRLMQNALWGQRSNFLDVPTDCPQRDERLGWTADAQVFVNTACYHMDCRDFYRKFLCDMRADQTRYYAGDIPAYSPSLKGEAPAGGAVWSDAAAIIPWHVYQQYGDIGLLRQSYPMMRDYAETLIRRVEAHGNTHIVDYGNTFGDWLAQDGATPQSMKGGTDDTFIRTVYSYHTLRLSTLAALELGESRDAEAFSRRAEDVRNAILSEFFSPNGRLCVDTQTGYAMALSFGLYHDKKKLVEGLRSRLRRDMYMIKSGFAGTPLMLPALLDCGMTEDAYRMLLNEAYPGWLYAVNLGATTIWERWNSLLPDGTVSGTGMNSLNHYAYGSVCEAIYSRVAGLRHASPGWKRALIAPKINHRLRRVGLSFDSPAGQYRTGWEIKPDGTVMLEAEVPRGAKAHIVLPEHPKGEAHEVGAGTYRYAYQPARDLLHPFSMDSLLIDLLSNDEAREVLSVRLPVVVSIIGGEMREFVAYSLREMADTLPMIDKSAAEVADRCLRSITV